MGEGKWRFIANMNVSRGRFVVVSCNEKLWVFGGWNDEGEHFNSTEFYDEKKDKWTMSTPMNEKRREHSAVAFLDKIYILGGRNGTSYTLNTAEVFDTVTQQFTFISPMSTPRRTFAASITGEKIFCFGGYKGKFLFSVEIFYYLYNGNVGLDSVESFNVITGEWKSEKNLSQRNQGLAAVTI